jgi:hypothetical protein
MEFISINGDLYRIEDIDYIKRHYCYNDVFYVHFKHNIREREININEYKLIRDKLLGVQESNPIEDLQKTINDISTRLKALEAKSWIPVTITNPPPIMPYKITCSTSEKEGSE